MPDFLTRLSLASDATGRQVRQAYARELKLVDQERDLEGFQHLRECYESALAWVERRDQPEDERIVPAPLPAQARPDAPASSRPDAAQDLSAAVFADFHARCPALAALPDSAGTYDATRAAPWIALLNEMLADPRLLHVDARGAFELRVAALLADGWQPGHHLLFGAADTVFGWSTEWQALERLGGAGALLETALAQREMFHSQDRAWRLNQRELLVLLRTRTPPDSRRLRHYAPGLNVLVAHCATLLHVVAPRDTLRDWVEGVEGIADAPPEAPEKPRAPKPKGLDDYRVRVALLGIVIVLTLVFGSSDKFRRRPAQPGVEAAATAALPQLVSESGSSPRDYMEPGAGAAAYELAMRRRSVDVVAGPATVDGPQVSDTRLREIALKVNYSPGPDAAPNVQTVVLQVRLDANGNVEEIRRLVSLADLAMADAFEQAIRETGPFPPWTKREFSLQYRWKPATR